MSDHSNGNRDHMFYCNVSVPGEDSAYSIGENNCDAYVGIKSYTA